MNRPKLTAEEKTEARDGFEAWLAHMDAFLEEFRASHPSDVAATLDYSFESLDAVEARLLDEFPTYDATLPPGAARRLNLFAVYVGETLRKQAGGRWDIPLDDPDYAWFKLPVIRGYGQHQNGESCPLTLVTTATDRRTGRFLRQAVEKRAGKAAASST